MRPMTNPLTSAAKLLGAKGGKSRSPAKLAAIADNAKRGGRARLVWELSADGVTNRIYRSKVAWIVELSSTRPGTITGRRVRLPLDAIPLTTDVSQQPQAARRLAALAASGAGTVLAKGSVVR